VSAIAVPLLLCGLQVAFARYVLDATLAVAFVGLLMWAVFVGR
jgi:hypothetical protein